MAQVSELKKLNRELLNEFATRHGIEEAESLEKFKTKEKLAEAVSPVVTPEQLAEFRVEMGLDQASSDDASGDSNDNGGTPAQPSTDESGAGGEGTPPAPRQPDTTPTTPPAPQTPDVTPETPIVTPNSAPPAPGESQIVDKSAPGDNNIAEKKSGERQGEGNLAEQQPGDPKVKTNDGGVVTERDATKSELENVDARKKPETVVPDTNGLNPQERDAVNDFGGDNGQSQEEAEIEPTVKLKNPSGRVVDVRVKDIAHQKMFAAGFQTIEGEDYPTEVVDLEDAYKNNLHARNIYNDVDQSDPVQSKSKGDIARRQGTKKRGDSDGEPQARVAAPKNETKPATFEGVDRRENGQVVNPKTSNPLKSNRLSQALQK